jgi:hypothetical protein
VVIYALGNLAGENVAWYVKVSRLCSLSLLNYMQILIFFPSSVCVLIPVCPSCSLFDFISDDVCMRMSFICPFNIPFWWRFCFCSWECAFMSASVDQNCLPKREILAFSNNMGRRNILAAVDGPWSHIQLRISGWTFSLKVTYQGRKEVTNLRCNNVLICYRRWVSVNRVIVLE